jgi:hypothetical protein
VFGAEFIEFDCWTPSRSAALPLLSIGPAPSTTPNLLPQALDYVHIGNYRRPETLLPSLQCANYPLPATFPSLSGFEILFLSRGLVFHNILEWLAADGIFAQCYWVLKIDYLREGWATDTRPGLKYVAVMHVSHAAVL